MSDQRTEQPTQRRLDEARRKGEGVGRSHELTMAVTLGVAVLALPALLPPMAMAMAANLRFAIGQMGAGPTPDGHLLGVLGGGFGAAFGMVLPLTLLMTVAGVVATLAGGGFTLSMHRVRFDASRMNPLTGLRRLLDKSMVTRLGISLGKLGLLLAVGWSVLGDRLPVIATMAGSNAATTTSIALGTLSDLGLSLTLLLGMVALTDFVIQRRRAKGQLRMARHEVKREAKDQEGDPLIRAQRRQRARQLAFARMMDAVPTADVVVVNPIHLAVALKYDSLTMRAPRIVAKGQRLMAARIRDVAREHGVPIVEDVPLARALFPRPIGAEVPPQLYRAVARILIIVHGARFGARRATAGGAR